MKRIIFIIVFLSVIIVNSFAQNKGVRVGNWTWFYKDGTKEQEGTYDEKGKKINTWIYYYENGNIKKEECYSANGFNRAYYNNKQLYFAVEIKDFKRVGSYTEYHRNGELKMSGTYVDDELEHNAVWFYENGNKEMEGSFMKGKRTGLWKYYYRESGSLGSEGEYLNDKENGHWTYYYEASNQNQASEKRREGNYENGNREGEWITYYENGKILHKGSYKLGLEEGKIIKDALEYLLDKVMEKPELNRNETLKELVKKKYLPEKQQ